MRTWGRKELDGRTSLSESGGGSYVAIVWYALLGIVLLSAVVSVVCVLRSPSRLRAAVLGAVLLVAGVVAALMLYTPASATLDPTIGGGPAECPFDTVEGARPNVDHNSRVYTFWEPCEKASRLRLAAILGGYALVSGGVGVWMLTQASRRTPGKRDASSPAATRIRAS